MRCLFTIRSDDGDFMRFPKAVLYHDLDLVDSRSNIQKIVTARALLILDGNSARHIQENVRNAIMTLELLLDPFHSAAGFSAITRVFSIDNLLIVEESTIEFCESCGRMELLLGMKTEKPHSRSLGNRGSNISGAMAFTMSSGFILFKAKQKKEALRKRNEKPTGEIYIPKS